MIRRNFISLDISGEELRAVALRRQRSRGRVLVGARNTPLPKGSWLSSVREENILDRPRFVEAIREVLDPLSCKEDRIALSLPDPIGRFMLTEVESAFKSRQEGFDVIKWQLKKSLPTDPRDIQLDYQILEKTETGRYRLAVSLMSRTVLLQYEECLAEAGYHAVVVDFHSLNLFNYYRSRLDLGEDFVFVGVDGRMLNMQFFQGRIPCLHRYRNVIMDPAEVYKEINLSFAAIRESYPGFRRAGIFLHTDWKEHSALQEAIQAAFERDAVLLDPKLERIADTPSLLPSGKAKDFAAAVGAAERMM